MNITLYLAYLIRLDLAAIFRAGILIEDTFNGNSTMIYERPHESAISAVVQVGDLPAFTAFLRSGNASVYDVGPYGLGLLYVSLVCFW